MIYITGDTHSDFHRFSRKRFSAKSQDYVVICGDFGGVWDQSPEELYWLNWLNEKPWTTLFVDGNHENYDLLSTYPVEQWNGGSVQFIRPRIIHLMRGQIFDIDGYRFFVMGGASSHDLGAGILEPSDPAFAQKRKCLDRARKEYRVNHQSWWKAELPSEAEYAEGLRNLEKTDFRVDVVLSHCAPTQVQRRIGGDNFEKDFLTDYLEQLGERCFFQKWFFGHYHQDLEIGVHYVSLYEKIVPLDQYVPCSAAIPGKDH